MRNRCELQGSSRTPSPESSGQGRDDGGRGPVSRARGPASRHRTVARGRARAARRPISGSEEFFARRERTGAAVAAPSHACSRSPRRGGGGARLRGPAARRRRRGSRGAARRVPAAGSKSLVETTRLGRFSRRSKRARRLSSRTWHTPIAQVRRRRRLDGARPFDAFGRRGRGRVREGRGGGARRRGRIVFDLRPARRASRAGRARVFRPRGDPNGLQDGAVFRGADRGHRRAWIVGSRRVSVTTEVGLSLERPNRGAGTRIF